MAKTLDDLFVVIYRRGGPLDCEWRRVIDLFYTRKSANDKADELLKAGHYAETRTLAEHERKGLPTGWDEILIDPRQDRIETNGLSTRHVVASFALGGYGLPLGKDMA